MNRIDPPRSRQLQSFQWFDFDFNHFSDEKVDNALWRDDQVEKPTVRHRDVDSGSENGSVADLRHEREQQELKEKKRAYDEMQMKLKSNQNMTSLDLIRSEVENGWVHVYSLIEHDSLFSIQTVRIHVDNFSRCPADTPTRVFAATLHSHIMHDFGILIEIIFVCSC